jgi:hypothetical protein
MTKNEIELLTLIRENDNPEEALMTAIEIITSFLEQSVSYQSSSVGFLQELA